MTRLLLLSNSTMPGTAFFTWPQPWVKSFLKNISGEMVFIPYAAVTLSFDEYASKVEEVFGSMGFSIRSVHRFSDPRKAITEASAVVVGGGNTFALLSRIYENNLLDLIRERVAGGCPYIGWSAGSNLACPTIMTTNDMPVIQPPSFEALNLVPFQINPHYHELRFEGQGGETRKERLEEFLAMNSNRKVIGLPEGMLLQRDGDSLWLRGNGVAKLYSHNADITELISDTDLSVLLPLG